MSARRDQGAEDVLEMWFLNRVFAYGSGTNEKLSRLNHLSWRATTVAAYTYFGAGGIAVVDYTQPDVRLNLAFNNAVGDPADGHFAADGDLKSEATCNGG